MPGDAALTVKARRLAGTPARRPSTGGTNPLRNTAAAPAPAAMRLPLEERAHQNRAIVYFLQQPETHAFDLYHDYTESRPAVDKYLNVVRAGSTVAHPSARILDTGEELKWEVVTGDAIRRAGLDVSDVTPQTQVVVFHFAPVKPNGSVRLRMYETYTDSARYRLDGDLLVWDRSFGRPANAVVLPAGWYVTNSAIPATISETADGRVRLDFINPRPDAIDVFITATIIVLAPRHSEDEKVLLLNAGADDYVTKPFSVLELAARARAQLRRARTGAPATPAPMTIHGLSIDPVTRRVERDGRQIHL